MPKNQRTIKTLAKMGQVASFAELEGLVFDFESVLQQFDIAIQTGSELEAACYSVLEILGRNQNIATHDANEDIREIFTEVLGIWVFLKKVARLHKHRCFPTFVPHLDLLNKGTVVQNKRVRVCQEATNKIFELLFALVLLDVSDEVIIDHPHLAKGDNPDILATIAGKCWGFACKTVYGASGKTLFDNLKKGVEQIEAAPKAQIGIVVLNLRNMISHDECWPLLNVDEYKAGAEPIFGTHILPENSVASKICEAVERKRDEVVTEIGFSNVINLFAGKKALPAFLAFCQTCTGKASDSGSIPTSILTLSAGSFGDIQAYQPVFTKINSALHDRYEPNGVHQ